MYRILCSGLVDCLWPVVYPVGTPLFQAKMWEVIARDVGNIIAQWEICG